MKAEISFLGGKRFKAKIRDFEIETDLPQERGGANGAPTPSELFIASLGTCTGLTVMNYLENAGVSSEGLRIDVDWEFAKEPHRIGKALITIQGLSQEAKKRKAAVLKMAQHCTVHTTLENKPEISIEVE